MTDSLKGRERWHMSTQKYSLSTRNIKSKGKGEKKNLGTACIPQGRQSEGTFIFLPIFLHSTESTYLQWRTDKNGYFCQQCISEYLPTTETRRLLTLVSHIRFVQALTFCLCFFHLWVRWAHKVWWGRVVSYPKTKRVSLTCGGS